MIYLGNGTWSAEVERDLANHPDVEVREAVARLKGATHLSELDYLTLWLAHRKYQQNCGSQGESDPPDVQGAG